MREETTEMRELGKLPQLLQFDAHGCSRMYGRSTVDARVIKYPTRACLRAQLRAICIDSLSSL